MQWNTDPSAEAYCLKLSVLDEVTEKVTTLQIQ